MTAEPAASAGPRVWRVSDLNRRVRGLLDADRALADVWVEGEVSQPSYPPSGHCFFTLKDAHSQIRAVLFREELARATVRPEHGAQLVCHGKVRAYEPQGVYQLYVESVTPVGAGDLHAQYEALRAKLAAEGLFEESRKRPLPRWPRRIGVVTSPVGAVWDDICTVLRRRYPMVEVVLSPAAVQGGIAAPAIIRALKRLYGVRDLDLVILARGGGSIEDLWGFNDEQVVRTVVASPIPVVVGVGHESDVTLADFVADRRAPTPSAAAEISVPDGTQLPAILNRLGERAATAVTARVEAGRRATRGEGRALIGLKPDLVAARQRAAELLDRSFRATNTELERRRLAAAGLRDSLRALGPLATLDRGYAVARRADGMIVRDPGDVAEGDALEVVVARGAVDTRVTTVRPGAVEELLS